MQIAVSVSDPSATAACGPVAGLESALVLSVTDITVGPDKGKPIGDSENIFGTLNANGLTVGVGRQPISDESGSDHPAIHGESHLPFVRRLSRRRQTADGMPAAGEVCTDVIVKGKK